jgi:hypothetical protein
MIIETSILYTKETNILYTKETNILFTKLIPYKPIS